MPPELLEAVAVTKAFGAFKAVADASVSVAEGEILGLIGPNGAGKSTFFNCLTGDLAPTSGTIRFQGADVTRQTPEQRAALGIARTFQVPLTFEGMTVLENVMIGAFLRTPRPAEARDRARQVIERVGLAPFEQTSARSLGTPGRKRLEIARALATEPRVLLLDEAMAGLTPSEVQMAIELVRGIHGGGITLVIVEHIMEVIVTLAHRVVCFHQGRPIAAGNAGGGDAGAAGDRGLSGPARGREGGARMSLLSVERLEVRYGDLIGVADVSFEVPEGGIVALLGSNGAGKTTTLNAIAGLIPASGGTIRFRGQSIGGRPAYAIVRQGLALSPEGWRLFASQTVEANLRLGATPLGNRGEVGALLDQVYALFPRLAERRRQRAGTMSGGERQMLAVGRALMSAPTLLMLDEPSLGLAPAIVETMYEAFGRLHAAGLTILLAEQSVELALEFADTATVLQVGRSVLSGTASDLADDPEVQRVYMGLG